MIGKNLLLPLVAEMNFRRVSFGPRFMAVVFLATCVALYILVIRGVIDGDILAQISTAAGAGSAFFVAVVAQRYTKRKDERDVKRVIAMNLLDELSRAHGRMDEYWSAAYALDQEERHYDFTQSDKIARLEGVCSGLDDEMNRRCRRVRLLFSRLRPQESLPDWKYGQRKGQRLLRCSEIRDLLSSVEILVLEFL